MLRQSILVQRFLRVPLFLKLDKLLTNKSTTSFYGFTSEQPEVAMLLVDDVEMISTAAVKIAICSSALNKAPYGR